MCRNTCRKERGLLWVKCTYSMKKSRHWTPKFNDEVVIIEPGAELWRLRLEFLGLTLGVRLRADIRLLSYILQWEHAFHQFIEYHDRLLFTSYCSFTIHTRLINDTLLYFSHQCCRGSRDWPVVKGHHCGLLRRLPSSLVLCIFNPATLAVPSRKKVINSKSREKERRKHLLLVTCDGR
jgi:hypothetical protein